MHFKALKIELKTLNWFFGSCCKFPSLCLSFSLSLSLSPAIPFVTPVKLAPEKCLFFLSAIQLNYPLIFNWPKLAESCSLITLNCWLALKTLPLLVYVCVCEITKSSQKYAMFFWYIYSCAVWLAGTIWHFLVRLLSYNIGLCNFIHIEYIF